MRYSRLIRSIFLLLTIIVHLWLSACASAPPGEGSNVLTEVHRIISVEEYQMIKKGIPPSSPYQKKVVFPIIKAGINHGVTLEDVRQGRFVICSCRCSAVDYCLANYPILLPNNVILGECFNLVHGNCAEGELPDDLIELETASPSWGDSDNTASYKLSKFRRHVVMPYEDWPRTYKYERFYKFGPPDCEPVNWPD